METWAQRIRDIVVKQEKSVVSGLIDDNHHMLLKRRDGSHADAGPIKVKPPGTVVFMGYEIFDTEPDIYFTKDGAIWRPATSHGRFTPGGNYIVDSGCWTGDRFLVGVYNFSDDSSCVLQSFDGVTWTFHPDKDTFNKDCAGNIYNIQASGTGLVIASAYVFMGIDRNSSVAYSHDFGETWEVVPIGSIDYPPINEGDPLYGIAIKNDNEFVVTDGTGSTGVYYTHDGGHHWTSVVYPLEFYLDSSNSSGMRYFNGYWWFYGIGSGTGEWDTPLIKSKDLLNWEPVVTPWSGTYPPLEAYLGRSHNGDSSTIYNLACDPLTNTMLAEGYSNVNGTYFLLSPDGGEYWIEIGHKEDDVFRTEHGWDGIYKWPGGFLFDYNGGMVPAYGWWFCTNDQGAPDMDTPPLLRISMDGQVTEFLYLPHQYETYGTIIMVGGDVSG